MRVLVIVPAFNESGSIIEVVERIKQNASVDILVIDDGSTDQTAILARQVGAMVAVLPINLGIGGAVQTGFQYGAKHDYDIVIQIDGDGQHDPAYINALIAPIKENQADMVIGSRFLAEKSQRGFQSTLARRAGIQFFVQLINRLTGVYVTDPTSGFRAFNKKLIHFFAGQYPQDFPEPEAIVVAHRCGCVIVEIPVIMYARAAGTSSIRYFKSIYYMLKVTLAIMLRILSDQRVKI